MASDELLEPAAAAESSSRPYVVVARRYRPQDFSQLIGQGQVSQALANAITTNRVGHAYLFTGARGVGKTSTARIFAKALNCVEGPTTTPCGECDICQGIASGGDVDVLEIDGASNRGIDEIRQLRSNVNVRPSRARYKIYIIDEVHMLTTQAFNALLKTLEEPPEHVKFLFCTTEADKIPITVLSRCQRFDFAPIELKAIVERLQHICASERVEAEPDALQVIARRAAGSMRDSQSLLEQILSFGGQKITLADVHSLLGTAHSARLVALAECVARRDAAAALAQIEAALGEGVDLGALTEQLLGYVRDTLATLVGCPPELLLHTGASDLSSLQNFGRQTGLETLLAMAQILDHTLTRLRQSTHVRTLVELGMIRLCKLDDLDALPALVAQLRDGAPLPVSAPPKPPPAPPAPRAEAASAPSPVPLSPGPPAAAQKKTPDLTAPVVSDIPPGGAESQPLDERGIADLWRQTLAELGDMTANFAAKANRIAISGPNRVVVSFQEAYNLEYCERPERRQRLEQTFSRLAGRNFRIDFAISADRPSAAPAETVRPATAKPAVSRRQRQQELLRHPLVRKAAELFDTEILEVLEPPPGEEVTDVAAGAATAPEER